MGDVASYCSSEPTGQAAEIWPTFSSTRTRPSQPSSRPLRKRGWPLLGRGRRASLDPCPSADLVRAASGEETRVSPPPQRSTVSSVVRCEKAEAAAHRAFRFSLPRLRRRRAPPWRGKGPCRGSPGRRRGPTSVCRHPSPPYREGSQGADGHAWRRRRLQSPVLVWADATLTDGTRCARSGGAPDRLS